MILLLVISEELLSDLESSNSYWFESVISIYGVLRALMQPACLVFLIFTFFLVEMKDISFK